MSTQDDKITNLLKRARNLANSLPPDLQGKFRADLDTLELQSKNQNVNPADLQKAESAISFGEKTYLLFGKKGLGMLARHSKNSKLPIANTQKQTLPNPNDTDTDTPNLTGTNDGQTKGKQKQKTLPAITAEDTAGKPVPEPVPESIPNTSTKPAE